MEQELRLEKFASKLKTSEVAALKRRLAAGGILLFYVRHEDDPLSSVELYLNADEIKGLERFKYPERLQEYLLSRWLFKTVLAGLLGLAPIDLKTQTGELGKLFINPSQNTLGLDFNISHKNSLTVLGVVQNQQIGVDVEQQRDQKTFKDVAQKFFQESEVTWMLAASSYEQQQERFFRLWSMKEAVLKTVGAGVFRNVHQVGLQIKDDQFQLFSEVKPWSQSADWELYELTDIPAYRISVSLYKKPIMPFRV